EAQLPRVSPGLRERHLCDRCTCSPGATRERAVGWLQRFPKRSCPGFHPGYANVIAVIGVHVARVHSGTGLWVGCGVSRSAVAPGFHPGYANVIAVIGGHVAGCNPGRGLELAAALPEAQLPHFRPSDGARNLYAI